MEFLKRIGAMFIELLAKIHWNPIRALFNNGIFWSLTEEDWNRLHDLLSKNYYIILTRNSAHMSTYLVSIGTLFNDKRWGHWGHALMNLEGDDPTKDDFKLMEATGKGTHFSTFWEVFTCDSVALLKPKNLSADEWTAVMDKLLKQEGKEYDTLCDLANDQKVNCVEMCRTALRGEPNYETDFANFEAMIAKNKNLTPESFYHCPDFEVVWEVRR